MACLDNLIGVAEGVSTTTPDSGRYINELPMISIETAEATINSEYKSGKELLENKITQAQNRLTHEIRSLLAPKMRMSSVLQNDRVGEYPRTRETIAPTSGRSKGVRIDIRDAAYLELYINSLTLWLDGAETTTIYLYDLLTGEELDSYSITTVANEPTSISVAKGYQTNGNRSSFGLIVSTTNNSYRTTVYQGAISCRDCPNKPGNAYATFQGISFANSADKLYGNGTGESNTFGLSVDYSLNCTPNQWICNIKGLLVEPLMFKAGEMILMEAQHNPTRINSVVTFHAEDLAELIDYYRSQYKAAMKTVLANLKLPNSICFRHAPRVSYKQRIP